MAFTHLHLHTEYSLLDGAIKINKLIKKLKENDFTACAITDHGNMHGVLEFYYSLKQEGIKPIIGLECYFNAEEPAYKDQSFHITLLAKNNSGYKNLIKLTSISYLKDDKKHFYKKPRITFDDMKQYKDGLIMLSGCLAGPISRFILNEDHKRAESYLKDKFIPLFGEDLYLEIMRHSLKEQELIIDEFKKLSKKFNVKLVATNDTHYLNREDGVFHNILLALQMGYNFEEQLRSVNESTSERDILNLLQKYEKALGPTPEFYLKSEQEMRDLFSDVPEAIESTAEISDKCQLNIEERSEYGMPAYDLPEGYIQKGNNAIDLLLRDKCLISLDEKYTDKDSPIKEKVRQRFEYEYEIISKMNFSRYLLIVSDFIEHARNNNIPIGPGRGSVVGCMIAYLLDITSMDPLKYNLLFERFLNPERVSIPDIDIDVCTKKREELIHYIKEKYNEKSEDLLKQRVCQIATFNVMRLKGALRDTGRVLNIPLNTVNLVTKLVDATNSEDINEAIATDSEIEKIMNEMPLHRIWKRSVEVLTNIVRNSSIHAAGIVISDKPLVEDVPLFSTSEQQYLSQFQMDDISKVKLVKWDILGLKTLTVIYETEKMINKKTTFSIADIPIDDKKTFETIASGDVQGIFQLESSAGMASTIKRLKPGRFEDIIGAISVHRKGPMEAGLENQYIENKEKWETGKKDQIKKIEFDFGDILDDAYGTMIYQEHIMRIAEKVSKFTPSEADTLRSAVAKKKSGFLVDLRKKFISGGLENGYKEKDLVGLWEQIEKFAEYAFNKSHATAYAYLTYLTAFLKANHPVEFFTTLINNENDFDKCNVYYENANNSSINILSPDINDSYYDFSPEGTNIRFGLAHIKSVNSKCIEDIVSEREKNGQFNDIFDLIKRISLQNLNRTTLEVLIKVGAFKNIHKNSASLWDALDRIIEYGKKIKEQENSSQGNLFSDSGLNIDIHATLKNLKEVDAFSKNEILTFEKEYLGYYFSSHPVASYQKYYRIFRNNIFSVERIKEEKFNGKEDPYKYMMGVITKIEKKFRQKDKKTYMGLTIEDLSGTIKIHLYSDVYEELTKKFGEDYHKYIDKKKFNTLLFQLKRSLNDEASIENIFEVEQAWELFKNNADIVVDFNMSSKLANSLAVVKNFFEKNAGKRKTRIIIENVPIYDIIYMDLPEKHHIKMNMEVYNEFKENFADFDIVCS